jgi:hypothetical protein
VQTFRENLHVADLRPTLVYFSIAFAAIVAGIVLRFVPLNLPEVVVRYGGSFLWAFMLYFLIAALLANRLPLTLALIAGVFESLVEFSRLYHTPSFDAFKLSLAGALLLGRVFNPWHLLLYWVAVALAALLDGKLIRRGSADRPRAGRALSSTSR